MLGVGVGVDQADAQRFDTLLSQLPQLHPHVIFVQWRDDLAFAAYAPANLDGVFQCGQWFWLGPDDPSGQSAGHEGPGDLQHLPESIRGHQADAGTLAFEDRVGGHCGAVQHVTNLFEPNACQLTSVLDTAEHPDRLIGGGGRGLRTERLAAFLATVEDIELLLRLAHELFADKKTQ